MAAEFGGTHEPSGPRGLGVQPPLQLPDRPELVPLVDNLSTLPSMVMRASLGGLVHTCGHLAILAARERSPQHQWETSATSNSLPGGRRQQWLSPRGGLTALERGRSAAPRLRHDHEHMAERAGERTLKSSLRHWETRPVKHVGNRPLQLLANAITRVSAPSGRCHRRTAVTRWMRSSGWISPRVFIKPGADALEDAIWSARRNTVTGYGIGVFDLDPGGANELTTITMRYYHAPGADAGASHYELFDTVVLAKERRDT
jgi:hypothetical protein